MPSSYTEELAEWVKKREAAKPKRQDKNWVASNSRRINSYINQYFAMTQ